MSGDTTRTVRVEEQLKIKIGEAKNLPSRTSNNNSSTSQYHYNGNPHPPSALRDVYCTVALDQEEITRTPICERTLAPFFGEEYQFEIPRKFRYLAIYVWDRDQKHPKQDRPIGKIAIKREELHTYNHKDHWFSLRPVDADSEVQGMIHVGVAIDEGTGNLKRKSTFDTDSVNTPSSSAFGSCSSDMKENNAIETAPHGTMSRSESVKTNASAGKSRSIFSNPTELSLWASQSSTTSAPQVTSNSNKQISMLDPFRSTTDSAKSRVAISVHQCADLTKKNGNCDPYVLIRATYANKKTVVKRTKVRKKTVNPTFDETVYFDLMVDYESKLSGSNTYTVAPLEGADLCEVVISVWHDSGLSGDGIFLGELKLPMRGKQQQAAVQPKAWYFLQPRTSQSRPARSCATPPGTRLSADNKLGDNSLGSMRIQLVYTADYVFPLANYDDLLNMLVNSVDQRPITASAVYILGEIISNKTEVAQPLVRIFTHKACISPMIKALADHEISKLTDPTTIFRGNTLVSKMMDEAMRLSGLHYLHTTLRPIVELIVAERRPCEIDPTRVKDAAAVETNLVNLQEYVSKVFTAIMRSAVHCPPVLCRIFHDLRECAAKHFPANREVRYSVVSGFIFLRFFAPAILGPKLFDLTTEQLDSQTTRTLTLISKTIQSLGNLVSSRSAQQPCKEVYTGQLYKHFLNEKHVEEVKHFLEVISTVGGANCDADSLMCFVPVLLKEGLMAKRSQGRKRFGRRTFKSRFFRLTTQSLSYAKSKGKNAICDIPLSEILAVEKLSEDSFKLQNVFQIIRKDRTLYVQTSNCVEQKEWVDMLSKICQSNSARLEYFHTHAFINGAWTCCHQTDQYAQGCTSATPNQIDVQLANTLDPARDLQRLNSLILNILQGKPPGKDVNNYPTGTFDDPQMTKATLAGLIECSVSLDTVYRSYRANLSRDMKYGSFQAPIGDDNYLHMSGFGNLAAISAAAAAQVHQQQAAVAAVATMRSVALYNS